MSRCPNCSWENSESQHFCGECGTPLPDTPQKTLSYAEAADAAQPPPPEFHPGQLFARRYQIIEELGTGGMGRVYRVVDRKLDEEIALKLIRPEIAAEPVDRRALRLRAQAGPPRRPQERRPDVRPQRGGPRPLHHHGVRPGREPEAPHPQGRPALRPGRPSPSPARSATGWPKPTASASSTGTSSPRTS